MLEGTDRLIIFPCNLMLLFLFHDDSVSKACINRCYIWLTIKGEKCIFTRGGKGGKYKIEGWGVVTQSSWIVSKTSCVLLKNEALAGRMVPANAWVSNNSFLVIGKRLLLAVVML